MVNPCLFGKVDLSDEEAEVRDLSPYAFRRIAALYYVMYQIAYLRSKRHFTLLWLFDEATFDDVFDSTAMKWLRYAIGRDDFKSIRALKDGAPGVRREDVYASRSEGQDDYPAKYGFWACSRTAPLERPLLPTCVLGVRYGVVAVHRDYSHADAPDDSNHEATRSRPSSLGGGRRIAGEFFTSLALAVHHVGRGARLKLQHKDEAGHYRDCLDLAQQAYEMNRRNVRK
jgi:hypothetical protein